MMVAASKEMPQFVSQQNPKQCGSKGESGEQASRILVEKCESVQKFVDRNCFIVSVRDGELCARDKTCAKS